jgi:hypothetical protein
MAKISVEMAKITKRKRSNSSLENSNESLNRSSHVEIDQYIAKPQSELESMIVKAKKELELIQDEIEQVEGSKEHDIKRKFGKNKLDGGILC